MKPGMGRGETTIKVSYHRRKRRNRGRMPRDLMY